EPDPLEDAHRPPPVFAAGEPVGDVAEAIFHGRPDPPLPADLAGGGRLRRIAPLAGPPWGRPHERPPPGLQPPRQGGPPIPRPPPPHAPARRDPALARRGGGGALRLPGRVAPARHARWAPEPPRMGSAIPSGTS